MTPGETMNRVDAWKWVERRAYEREAWTLSVLYSFLTGKTISPKKLLGGPSEDEKIDELYRRLEKRAAK